MNHIDQSDPTKTVTVDASQFVLKADHEKELAKRDSRIAELEAQVSKQTARADAADALLAPANLDKLVMERQAIVDLARVVCGKEFKADGKSAHEIRLETVKKARPAMKLDGKSEAYVAGVFESLAGEEAEAAASHAQVAQSLHAQKTDAETPDKVGVSFDNMIKDLHGQFQENK